MFKNRQLHVSIVIGCLFMVFQSLSAQVFEYQDRVYVNHIKSVTFHIPNLPVSDPIVDLSADQQQLVFGFDDMDGDVKDYEYRIVHCTKDWEQSDLNQIEFLEGFENERIRDFELSRNTYKDYTHYYLDLPNRFVRWKLSGNYLLIITLDDQPVITKRFVVVENLVSTEFVISRPRNALHFDTHHEIFFEIDLENLQVYRPRQEIDVVFLQNGRWDNAIGPLPPRNVVGSRLIFNYLNEMYFPAGNEFRGANLTTFKTAQRGVEEIRIEPTGLQYYLELDESMYNKYNFFDADINGHFVIDARIGSPDFRAVYGKVLFSLETPEQDGDVYLVGPFTNWDLDPQFVMEYSEDVSAYLVNPFMKQGYYDYAYWIDYGDRIDKDYFQGNFERTQNSYYALVYYRDFSGRYDRIIGVNVIR